MTRPLAAAFERDGWLATGGTLFASALQMAACRATLSEVLLDAAYTHAARLGERIAADIDREPWSLLRLWHANRGVWEAIAGAGPASVAMSDADLDRYLASLGELVASRCRSRRQPCRGRVRARSS